MRHPHLSRTGKPSDSMRATSSATVTGWPGSSGCCGALASRARDCFRYCADSAAQYLAFRHSRTALRTYHPSSIIPKPPTTVVPSGATKLAPSSGEAHARMYNAMTHCQQSKQSDTLRYELPVEHSVLPHR